MSLNLIFHVILSEQEQYKIKMLCKKLNTNPSALVKTKMPNLLNTLKNTLIEEIENNQKLLDKIDSTESSKSNSKSNNKSKINDQRLTDQSTTDQSTGQKKRNLSNQDTDNQNMFSNKVIEI